METSQAASEPVLGSTRLGAASEQYRVLSLWDRCPDLGLRAGVLQGEERPNVTKGLGKASQRGASGVETEIK